jgi:hypothetical protein
MLSKLLTEAEVAALGIATKSKLRRLRWEGEGPDFVKLGHQVLYPADKLTEWLSERTFQSTSQYPQPRKNPRLLASKEHQ